MGSIIYLCGAAFQVLILFALPPSPFDRPAAWQNVVTYIFIAALLILAWNVREPISSHNRLGK